MKIKIVSGDLNKVGGIENYIKILKDKLDGNNHDVSIFIKGLKYKYHQRFIYIMPLINLFHFLKFTIDIKNSRPDIIHLNPCFQRYGTDIVRSFIFLNLANLLDCPVLFFIRGFDWNTYNTVKNNNILKLIFRGNLNKSNKILVLSKDFKNALVDLGIDEEKIDVTSTMVESEKFNSNNKEFDEAYKVLFCSRMVKGKGIFELINAIPKVLEEYPKVTFIFMGDGNCLDNLQRKVKKRSLQKNVIFTGYKTGQDKINIYERSHIFILPSYTEGFPNVILEAMAAGLPIVATPVGAIKYAVKDGVNGYKLKYVPPKPEEIADKIVRLLDDPHLMREMSRNNLREAKEKYDVKAVSGDIIKIYEEIAAK